MNAIQKLIAWTYSNHPWLWPACVKSRFPFTRTVEIKGLCLQLKRPETKYAAQKINFLTWTVANGPPLPPWKFHLVITSSWWVIICLFFHPINMSSTWRHKFYWFCLILTAALPTCCSSSNLYNSGTRRDIRELKQTRAGSQKTAFILMELQKVNYSWLNFAFSGSFLVCHWIPFSFKLISNTIDALWYETNSSTAKPCPLASTFSPFRQAKHSYVATNGRHNGWTIARRCKKEWAFKSWLKSRATVN